MAKLVYHVDDSNLARRLVGDALKKCLADIELVQFDRGESLIEALSKTEVAPWAIFADNNMPVMSGIEVLSWVKRNPKFHTIPFVLVSAETEEKEKSLAFSTGALECIEKPIKAEAIAGIVGKITKLSEHPSTLGLDQNFVEEALGLTDEIMSQLKSLNPDSAKEIYRLFHTIKGGAASLQFPTLAKFVHEAESFLSFVQSERLYTIQKVHEILSTITQSIENQIEQIRQAQVMALPPNEIYTDIEFIQKAVKEKINLDKSPGAAGSQVVLEANVQTDSPVVGRTSTSLRLTKESLDKLYQKFKKVLQLRVRLNSFNNTLGQEFHDEQFPRDLGAMIEELNQAAMDVMEFFMSIRVVSASRLKVFSENVIQVTSQKLSKPVKFEFECEPHLEIDQTILELVESGLTHLLRNSIDHGIESVEKRVSKNKPEEGTVKLAVKKVDAEKIVFIIEDDGGGIDRVALSNAMAAKGIMTKEQIEKLPNENVYDLVFVDGLSTKAEVSDISGRGVGLSSVKESIEKMGGTIKVESQLGKGTRFVINLPRLFRL